jgi:hypothetical protein
LSGRGKPKSPEHRANIATANRGKPKSAEHRAKLSEATKRAWREGKLEGRRRTSQ